MFLNAAPQPHQCLHTQELGLMTQLILLSASFYYCLFLENINQFGLPESTGRKVQKSWAGKMNREKNLIKETHVSCMVFFCNSD